MKKTFLLLVLLLARCSAPVEPVDETITDSKNQALPTAGIYTLFTINTHDFVFPEKSIETINHIIDIHEEYDVPVDIYLDDQVFQVYLEQAPELIERLKTSPVVTVGYHIRPPYPYYIDFDFAGLADLSKEELYETIMDYETHSIDIETGLPTDEPGGYAYLSEVMGYPIPVAAVSNTAGFAREVHAQVLKDLGATYTVMHGRDIKLGDSVGELLIRPEDVDYKLYEKTREFNTGEEVFADAILQIPTEGLRFIGMKFHEDNFYCNGTPYWPIFQEGSEKGPDLEPPFNLDAAYDIVKLRTEEQAKLRWDLYESTVKYASEHPDEVHPIGITDLEKLTAE